MNRTAEIVKFLKDYLDVIDGSDCNTDEDYAENLAEVIEESNVCGDNLLMTQKECLDFYKSDKESLLEMLPQMVDYCSENYIKGFVYALELFSSREEF